MKKWAYTRFISCWKTPLSLIVPHPNLLRQLHPAHLSYSPALLHGDISKAVLRNGKTYLVLPRTERLSVIWSFQNTETLLVAPRRALCALSCFFQKHSGFFFYSENYAAACNRRDPIRLRSITFFKSFSVLLLWRQAVLSNRRCGRRSQSAYITPMVNGKRWEFCEWGSLDLCSQSVARRSSPTGTRIFT